MTIQPTCRSAFLLGALIAPISEVISFSTSPAFRPSARTAARPTPTTTASRTSGSTSSTTTSTTALSAGFVAERYLSTLTPFPDYSVPLLGTSSTEHYLNSLSRLDADPSRMAAQRPEEYLASVSRIVDESANAAARAVGDFSFTFSDGTSFYMAAEPSVAAVAAAEPTMAAVDAGNVAGAMGAAAAGFSDNLASMTPDGAVAAEAIENPAQKFEFMSQLSEMSYDNIVLPGNTKYEAAKQAGRAVRAANPSSANVGYDFSTEANNAAGAGAERISGASEKFNAVASEWSNVLSGWGEASAAQVGNFFQKGGASVQGFGQAVGQSIQGEANQLVTQGNQASNNAAQFVGDQSLSSLAGNVVAGIKVVGATLLGGLDSFLLEFAGTPLEDVVDGAMSSVAKIVDGAVQHVLSTVSNVGHISVAEAATNMIKLMSIVIKTLFAVLAAIFKTATGQGLGEYWVSVTRAVEQEASNLSTQAGSLATELSHKSLSELVSMVGQFSEGTSDLMAQSVGVMGGAVASGGNHFVDIAPTIMGSGMM